MNNPNCPQKPAMEARTARLAKSGSVCRRAVSARFTPVIENSPTCEIRFGLPAGCFDAFHAGDSA
jgi:hypothetical protein